MSPAVYLKHQKKSVKEAEANIQGAFHCKTPDCAGWTVIGKGSKGYLPDLYLQSIAQVRIQILYNMMNDTT